MTRFALVTSARALFGTAASATACWRRTWDTNASSFGRDPVTGFARSAVDNDGVQYGLKALNSGAISKAEFIALNRNTGGYTANGLLQAALTQADPEAVRLAYATGRINTGTAASRRLP
jgi:hypothetical protein